MSNQSRGAKFVRNFNEKKIITQSKNYFLKIPFRYRDILKK